MTTLVCLVPTCLIAKVQVLLNLSSSKRRPMRPNVLVLKKSPVAVKPSLVSTYVRAKPGLPILLTHLRNTLLRPLCSVIM